MKDLKIKVRAAVGDAVVIPDLENTRARVTAIQIGRIGITYAVAWFHGGKQKSAWLDQSDFIIPPDNGKGVRP